MRKKGKKKLAGKSSHLSPQPCHDSDFEHTLINLENYAKTLAVRYEVVRATGAFSGSEVHDIFIPVRQAELKYLITNIREAQAKGKNPDSCGNDKENQYYDRVRGYMKMWKVLSAEVRKEGRKSLMEVLRSDGSGGGGDKELRDGVFEMLLGVGVKISRLMAEYFSLFLGTLEDSEIRTRFQVVRSTLLIESLQSFHASPVIDKFVKVVDSAVEKIGFSTDKDEKEYQFLFGNRESELLGSIFFKVLHLEFAFCCPSVPKKLETKDLMSIKDFLEKLFEEKLGELSSEMNEFKKRCKTSDIKLSSKRSELKESLDSEIKEIWKGFTLDKLYHKN